MLHSAQRCCTVSDAPQERLLTGGNIITQNIGFISAKGGQGVTTTAAAFALALTDNGGTTALFITDDDGMAVLGLPAGERHDMQDGRLQVTTVASDAANGSWDFIVRDGDTDFGAQRTNYLVTRPCYLALRRAVMSSTLPLYAGIIAVMEEKRALGIQDIQSCLGHEVVAEVAISPIVARAIDAGLLAARLPEALAEVRMLAHAHRAEARSGI